MTLRVTLEYWPKGKKDLITTIGTILVEPVTGASRIPNTVRKIRTHLAINVGSDGRSSETSLIRNWPDDQYGWPLARCALAQFYGKAMQFDDIKRKAKGDPKPVRDDRVR